VLCFAFIAPYREAKIELKRGREFIGLTQRNLVPAVDILAIVKLVIPANHYPAVRLGFPPNTPNAHKMPPDFRYPLPA
jgi:hypothetical protein